MPRFFFSFGGTKFTHAQYINIMYELDSKRQKFDAWIGVAFLSDSVTKPVECAADMRRPIPTSNLICWIEFDKAEMRRMNRALKNQDILTQDLCLDIYYSSCFVEYPLYPFPCFLPHFLEFFHHRRCSTQYHYFEVSSRAGFPSSIFDSAHVVYRNCNEKSPIVKNCLTI